MPPAYEPLLPRMTLSVIRRPMTPEWTKTPPPWVTSAPSAPYGVLMPPLTSLMLAGKSDCDPPVIVKPSIAGK